MGTAITPQSARCQAPSAITVARPGLHLHWDFGRKQSRGWLGMGCLESGTRSTGGFICRRVDVGLGVGLTETPQALFRNGGQ